MTLRRLALAGVAALAIGSGGAQAATQVALELALVIDVSGSISTAEYNLQRQGYQNAFLDPTVQANILSFAGAGGIAVSVVQFSDDAATAIGWTQLTTAAEINAFAAALGAMTRLSDGFTGIAGGMAAGLALINDAAFQGIRKVMDVSGDGLENVSTDAAVRAQRDLAAAGGVTVNGLAIEGEFGPLGVTNHYTSNVITPDGLIYTATGFGTFEAAVVAKIGQEVIGVPEPMSLALFGVGLAGLGLIRRRRTG